MSGAAPDAPLKLDMAADTALVRVARLAASSLATDADFDVDELEDLRLALGELVTAAIRATGGDGRVHLAFRVDELGISVRGRCPARDLQIDEMAGAMLDRCVDLWQVDGVDDGATFSLTKLRSDVG